ncbi:hypothetical protein SAMN04488038_109104 [Solimonas aquatica]|uniref:Uncharacterized protein n=1 Tax=Solimonas aquatica TaxID=489703 RepID=A0A1H9HZE7_9GAMM|nr:hypothetical protein [Solimonas aquatica]SEQ67730.1 hypothetical protein SAMN04488038_109104 [Solimonas aquatica]
MSRSRFYALLLLAPLAAAAQNEMPAISGLQPGATPPPASPPAADEGGGGAGTTIVGERESPIGLYITPWRDAAAEKDIDRPARLLQEKLLPLDKTVFQRQIDYYDALSAELKKKGLVTPAAR